MTPRLSQLTLLALLCGGAGAAFAQALPTTQPSLIQIFREEVKVGRAAEHARIEAGWPAAYAKANSTDYYLAFVSMTGPSEAWYVTPSASFAARGESMRREGADPVLTAELARLSRADAEVLTGARAIEAVARPDLSLGAFPDLARQRFWEITTFRVRPGHASEFEAAAKAYGTAAQRAVPGTNYRIYQVIAGAPEPTFYVFSSVESFARFDDMMAAGIKTAQGFTAEERATLDKFSREGLLGSDTQRFRLDPGMSYVARETRATDPAFWMPKPATARP